MRLCLQIAALCLLVACNDKKRNVPPADKFYFPAGLHHAKSDPASMGFLYVVSANFDRRYDTGLLTAVDLDKVGLPTTLGQVDPTSGPAQLRDLHTTAADTVVLADFGGDLGVQARPDGVTRLFIPSRAEEQKLMVVDAKGSSLSCVATSTADGGVRPTPVDPRDCGEVGASLVEYELTPTGIPRADSPMSAAVSSTGMVWVSSGRHSDTPRFSQTNYNDFVVRVPGDQPRVDATSFVGLGPGSTHAVATGRRWTYFSGRFPSAVVNPPLIRLVECLPGYPCEVVFPNLENDVRIGEARGVALSSDETRLFLAGRQASGVLGADVLVIASIIGADTGFPAIYASRTVPLPQEPQMVQTISRGPGRRDLVLITCSGAGSLVIYDDERGDLAAQVDGVGLQPSSFTVDLRPPGARVYLSNFTDGRVAVVDIPDLDLPQTARLVAHLGSSQVCLTRSLQCDGGM
ncbi:MAG: hypothetical protein IPJ65_18135 [Archangiaceae bacterium]|nr:hypothetical protein [Archangiaceae bacterium]